MEYALLHNGKNIIGSIKVSGCRSCDRYGGMLDDLAIAFATENHEIEFYENDELEIRTAGGFTTGTMYLDSCVGNDGLFTIKAISCRHNNKKKKSRIWHRVKLTKLIEDVAKDTGLTPLLYGISDYTYKSISQVLETDLQMLARRLKREGYSLKCDNGNLIVFNEYYLEHNSTPITINKADAENGYSFKRSTDGLRSVTVRYFDTETLHTIEYTATDESISGGEDCKIKFVSDLSEAQRVARSYLREANKFYITGQLSMAYNGNISAGTVADLTGFDEFDGRYVIYEIMNDFVREKTSIKVRKILDY